MGEETRLYINDAGTVIVATEGLFKARYKPAGYRPLKDGEDFPLQQAEVDAAPPPPEPVAPPDAKALAAIRKGRK